MNNDDMDEAFRQAANEYELNEELAADWNSVHAALQHDQPVTIPEMKEKKRRRFILFWWLLLIPAGLLIAYGTGVMQGDKNVAAKQANNKIVPRTANSNNTYQSTPTSKHNGVSGSSEGDDATTNIVSPKESTDKKPKNRSEEKSIISAKHTTVQQPEVANSGKHDVLNLNNSTQPNNTTTQAGSENYNKNIAGEEKHNTSANDNNTSSQTEQLSESAQPSNIDEQLRVVNDNQVATTSSNNTIALHTNDSTAHESGVINESKTTNTSTAKTKKQAIKSLNTNARQAYAYAGLTGNIDLSFIKSQHTSSLGYGGGIVGGYHFKSGVSIESGVSLVRKNYYTSGQYFNKSKLNTYLQGVDLTAANGNCNMWEIPLNVRYDFNSKKKYNWYATAGLSSYLMKKEYYDFTWVHDGVTYAKAYNYYHSSKDWFSVLNIGAGINMQASKKLMIQLQPYYKIPLSGIGIGGLQLSSAGVNVNVVHRIP